MKDRSSNEVRLSDIYRFMLIKENSRHIFKYMSKQEIRILKRYSIRPNLIRQVYKELKRDTLKRKVGSKIASEIIGLFEFGFNCLEYVKLSIEEFKAIRGKQK